MSVPTDLYCPKKDAYDICQAVTFSVLLLAPSSRAFFVQYGLTGGVLSVVVAMSPSVDKLPVVHPGKKPG